VGEGIIIKAIAQATGRAPEKVKSDIAIKGDVGLVAEASKGTQRTLSMFK
jgi:DNA ligase-1